MVKRKTKLFMESKKKLKELRTDANKDFSLIQMILMRIKFEILF